jgi:hypothetical protein
MSQGFNQRFGLAPKRFVAGPRSEPVSAALISAAPRAVCSLESTKSSPLKLANASAYNHTFDDDAREPVGIANAEGLCPSAVQRSSSSILLRGRETIGEEKINRRHVRFWPDSDLPQGPLSGRFQVLSGRNAQTLEHMLSNPHFVVG